MNQWTISKRIAMHHHFALPTATTNFLQKMTVRRFVWCCLASAGLLVSGCQPMSPLPASNASSTTNVNSASGSISSSGTAQRVSTAEVVNTVEVGLTPESSTTTTSRVEPTPSPVAAAVESNPSPLTPPVLPDLAGDSTDGNQQEGILETSACDEPPATKAPAAKVPQVTPLFDGKTLKNWKSTEFGGEGEVEVVDGQLKLGVGSPLTGVTWTGPKLPTSNYEIVVEAMRVDGSDFFCGLTFPVKNDPCSLIIGGWGGGLVGLSSIDGMDASENQTGTHRAFENNKWYTIRLKVTDDKIVVWVDKEQVIEQELKDVKLSIRIEVTPSKPLGICAFTSTSLIRKFELTELPQP